MRSSIITVLVAASVALAATAHAQVVFPADSEFRSLRCGNAVMTDRFADDAGALEERDVVGDTMAAAGFRASDATNLYLRLRLEEDPAPAGALAAFSWGMAFDLDADLGDYELLILVDGTGGADSVGVFTNNTTTQNNDPTDPADQPAAQTYTFANNARTGQAGGTNVGGNADFFLDFAVPWSALVPLGLERDTPVRVWAASSSSANSLNGDFACHDRAGGAPTLTGTASDPTTGDPNDPGAGGGGQGRLEGGGGCATGGGAAGWLVALAVVAVLRRRRRP
jgi:MYXO-CTERM domain-containing protein